MTNTAIASALYDTFNTARLSEHPEDLETYLLHAEVFVDFLRRAGFVIVPGGFGTEQQEDV